MVVIDVGEGLLSPYPEIIEYSDETEQCGRMFEHSRCTGEVERCPVVVKALNRDGEPITITGEGLGQVPA